MHLITGLQVGVLGNGLSALTAAYLIKKAGHEATVLETDFGHVRVGKPFQYGSSRSEQFFQFVTEQDAEVHALVKELGIEIELQWLPRPRRRRFWPIRKPAKVAVGLGLAESIRFALRHRVRVEELQPEMDLRTDFGTPRFDAIISTLPIDQLEDLAGELVERELPGIQAGYRTFVNLVLISSNTLWKKYSTFVENHCNSFSSVSVTTDVDSGLSVISVCGYSDASDVDLRKHALRFLSENFAEFQPSSVEAMRVFRPDYDGDEISARVGKSRLFLASPELGAAMPVCMNTDILLAKQAVAELLKCAPTFASGVRQAALADAHLIRG